MDACSKTLAESQSLLQIVWARYAFAVPVILATTPRTVWPVLFRVASPALQAFRGLLPMVASFAVVAGLALLPLAEVTALTFASPLVVVALSGPLLGERTSLHDWLGVLAGFAGILVIVRPGPVPLPGPRCCRSPVLSASRCSSSPPAWSAAAIIRRRPWPGPSSSNSSSPARCC